MIASTTKPAKEEAPKYDANTQEKNEPEERVLIPLVEAGESEGDSPVLTGDGEHLLFVYGTLKQGGRLHEWLRDTSTFVSTAVAPGYSLLDLGPYPAMVEVVGKNGNLIGPFKVEGEIFSVPEAVYDALVRMETRVGYREECIRALMDGSISVDVQAFVFGSINMGLSKWITLRNESEEIIGGSVIAA